MPKKSFFSGGLVCGLVLIVFGFAGAYLFLEAGQSKIFAAVDFDREGYMGFVRYTLVRILVGYGIFTIFALVTKGFMGLKAVIGASLVAWVLLYLPALILFYDLKLLDFTGTLKIGVWGEIEILAGMFAGRFVAERV